MSTSRWPSSCKRTICSRSGTGNAAGITTPPWQRRAKMRYRNGITKRSFLQNFMPPPTAHNFTPRDTSYRTPNDLLRDQLDPGPRGQIHGGLAVGDAVGTQGALDEPAAVGGKRANAVSAVANGVVIGLQLGDQAPASLRRRPIPQAQSHRAAIDQIVT